MARYDSEPDYEADDGDDVAPEDMTPSSSSSSSDVQTDDKHFDSWRPDQNLVFGDLVDSSSATVLRKMLKEFAREHSSKLDALIDLTARCTDAETECHTRSALKQLLCSGCNAMFDQDANGLGSCEVYRVHTDIAILDEDNSDYWADTDFDSGCHDTSFETNPGGYYWQCCERPGDAKGCTKFRHIGPRLDNDEPFLRLTTEDKPRIFMSASDIERMRLPPLVKPAGSTPASTASRPTLPPLRSIAGNSQNVPIAAQLPPKKRKAAEQPPMKKRKVARN